MGFIFSHVLCDGGWKEENSPILVLYNIMGIKLKDIIPTNAHLLKGDPLKIDQSLLTSESLPITRM